MYKWCITYVSRDHFDLYYSIEVFLVIEQFQFNEIVAYI